MTRHASSSSGLVSITNGRPSPRTELSVWNLSRSVMATSTGKFPNLATATVTTTHSLTGRGGMPLMRSRMVLGWLSSPSEMKTRMTRSHGLEARLVAKACSPAMISVYRLSIRMEANRSPTSAVLEKATQLTILYHSVDEGAEKRGHDPHGRGEIRDEDDAHLGWFVL